MTYPGNEKPSYPLLYLLPPSLGFAALDPPFTIQRIGISNDNEKLPSASTCFNVLKLPTYTNKKTMKEKLLVSITSGTGFEMS